MNDLNKLSIFQKKDINNFYNKKKRTITFCNHSLFKNRFRQRAIFPGGGPPSIFAAVSLYDRVRDGNGWFPHA